MNPILKTQCSWATKTQLECIQLFSDLVGGYYNIKGKFGPLGFDGVTIVIGRAVSTVHDNLLTRAVLLAHDRAIRVEIQPAGAAFLRFNMHKRDVDGSVTESHPTLDQAITDYRNSFIGRKSQ